MKQILAILVILAGMASAIAAARVDPTTLTVSGISAGGAMTVQFQVAFSSKVRAAGVIAGVPYYCSMDDVYVALDCMSDPYIINLNTLANKMQQLAAYGAVDSLDNLRKHAVLLFSGTKDTVVRHGTMIALAEQYERLGLTKTDPSSSNATSGTVSTMFDYPAEHSWVTNFYGNACGHLGSPFVNNCGVDFAGDFLRLAWRHLSLPFNNTAGVYNSANMHLFSQTYFGASSSMSLDSVGYVYIPAACESPSARVTCHVHLNFHGCEQQRTLLGDVYVAHTGLNEWAESNRVIVVYPQTIGSSLVPYNPKGCFDWWGYADSAFATKDGAQMSVVNAIVEYVLNNGDLPRPS